MAESDNKGTTFRSVEELAKELRVSRNSAYQGLRSGQIPNHRLGKRFIIPRAAVDEWLRNARKRQNPPAQA